MEALFLLTRNSFFGCKQLQESPKGFPQLHIFIPFILYKVTLSKLKDLSLFFHLHEVQFQRSVSTENLNNDFQCSLFIVNSLYHSTESGERAIGNLNRLVNHKRYLHLLHEFRILRSTNHTINILLTYRRRIIKSAKKTQTVRHKT